MAPAASHTSRHDGVVTLWFVNTPNPGAVLATQPRADRGFGRKLLAQLNPRWPITVIGQFPLNRSAPASAAEFYIAAYPGISMLQTQLEDIVLLSELSETLRECLPATDVYAFVRNPETTLGGFAHWRDGTLRRCFSAKVQRVYEDTGLPEPFEQPYWAGEFRDEHAGIALPFNPIDIVNAAELSWVGYEAEGNTDLNVVAYAIDGRPEPKVEEKKLTDVSWIAQQAASKLSLGENRRAYDDYEDAPEVIDAPMPSLAQSSARTLRKLGRGSRRLGKKAWQQSQRGIQQVGEKIRHIDRA